MGQPVLAQMLQKSAYQDAVNAAGEHMLVGTGIGEPSVGSGLE